MERERLFALRSEVGDLKLEFDVALELLKNTEDQCDRDVLLRLLREVIAETDEIIEESQKTVQAMQKRLRSSKQLLRMRPPRFH